MEAKETAPGRWHATEARPARARTSNLALASDRRQRAAAERRCERCGAPHAHGSVVGVAARGEIRAPARLAGQHATQPRIRCPCGLVFAGVWYLTTSEPDLPTLRRMIVREWWERCGEVGS